MRTAVPTASLPMPAETSLAAASFRGRHGEDPDRLLGLELQALARALLSQGRAGAALVRLLRRAFRHGRDQQQLLPPARPGDLRQVARPGTARLLLCGQGQPFPHPGQEAEGLRRAARADDECDAPARTEPRTGSLSA